MSAFRVGQRVRLIYAGVGVQAVYGFTPPAGMQGIVISDLGGDYLVSVFGVPDNPQTPGGWIVAAYGLRPLSDPLESAWASEKVKELLKLTREPLPLSPAHLDEVHS